MTLPDFAANVTSQLDGAILVNHAPGVDPAQAKAAIEAALADYPNVTVNDPDGHHPRRPRTPSTSCSAS